ncbi:MAG: hypothetical protein N2558_04155 [Patescibacteria group bacterium]|nr:hypothetical protein [Patescibacteria group bacterium]
MVNLIFADQNLYQGKLNSEIEKQIHRLKKAKSSKDLSTICIIPHSGILHTRAIQNWFYLAAGMNQKFIPMLVYGKDKAEVFNRVISEIIKNPTLSNFRFILTMHENSVPPPDGLQKLYENTNKYDVIGGLIWNAGIEKVFPLAFGCPNKIPADFIPIAVKNNKIIPCLGLSFGFTLFKTKIFKDKRIEFPWFNSENLTIENTYNPSKSLIPNMRFFEKIKLLGYKVCCDTRVRVGNYDYTSEIVW